MRLQSLTRFVYNRIRWHSREDNKNKPIKANPLLSANSAATLFILSSKFPQTQSFSFPADILLNNTDILANNFNLANSLLRCYCFRYLSNIEERHSQRNNRKKTGRLSLLVR